MTEALLEQMARDVGPEDNEYIYAACTKCGAKFPLDPDRGVQQGECSCGGEIIAVTRARARQLEGIG